MDEGQIRKNNSGIAAQRTIIENAEIVIARLERDNKRLILEPEKLEEMGRELVSAAWENDVSKVKDLINRGADINVVYKFKFGWMTPLTAACANGGLGVVKVLYYVGSDMNKAAKIGCSWTPIKTAIENKKWKVVGFLRGVDVKDPRGDGV